MSNTKEIYLTEEGLSNIKKELDYLRTQKRPEVIESLKEARALGDLSENAEYDAAKTSQAEVEGRIAQLEQMVDKAQIIPEIDTDQVSIGTKVKIEYVDDSEIEIYSIVGTNEADPFKNKISNESPIVKAILGLKAGETATVTCDAGNYDVKVLEIL